MDLALLTATELGAAYAAGETTPVEVLTAVERVIDEREPQLNALWVRDDVADVLAQAREATRRWRAGEQRGSLDGVPLTLKENIARRGVPMPAGTAGIEPVVPTQDAPITRRAHEAGLVVVGATTMPDWGMLSSGHSSRHGRTVSPLHPAWGTGGSSSGAGVAAAAGYGPLHVGTDIGGSIRLPGTWLGLTTLKPSAGRIPLSAPYLGRVAGPMTRCAADCALLMAALSGPDPVDWTSLPAQEIDWGPADLDARELRVGVWVEPGCGVAPEPEVVAVCRATAGRLGAAGAELVEVGPWLGQDLLDGIDLFWAVRSWADFHRLDERAQGRVLPYVADWVRGGAGASAVEVMDAYHCFARMAAATVEAWRAAGDPDLLLSPVAPCAAPAADLPMPYPDHGMGHIGFTVPWNTTGQPAGTVDAGQMTDGRPVGVQVVGRPFDDAGVLRALAWLERV